MSGGRPPLRHDHALTSVIRARVTRAEAAEFAASASALGISISDLIRSCCFDDRREIERDRRENLEQTRRMETR